MDKKKSDISILAFEKEQPPEISEKRKYTLIIVLLILVSTTLILVKKFGPGFFSFVVFLLLLFIPIYFVFDNQISHIIFPLYESNRTKLEDLEEKIADDYFSMHKFISPKYQDYIVVFLMVVFAVAGLLLASKVNNLLGIVIAAFFLSTTGVLSNYFLSDGSPYIFEKKHKQTTTNDHVHKIGPLVTQGASSHINV
jgi:hypothetical protein